MQILSQPRDSDYHLENCWRENLDLCKKYSFQIHHRGRQVHRTDFEFHSLAWRYNLGISQLKDRFGFPKKGNSLMRNFVIIPRLSLESILWRRKKLLKKILSLDGDVRVFLNQVIVIVCLVSMRSTKQVLLSAFWFGTKVKIRLSNRAGKSQPRESNWILLRDCSFLKWILTMSAKIPFSKRSNRTKSASSFYKNPETSHRENWAFPLMIIPQVDPSWIIGQTWLGLAHLPLILNPFFLDLKR